MVANRSCIGIAILVWLAGMLVACSSEATLDGRTLQAISGEATALLAAVPRPVGPVDVSNWPPGIRALKPQAVNAAAEGLYIEMGSLGVEAWGYFVPRDKVTFVAGPGGDPSYEALGYDVYRYRFKG